MMKTAASAFALFCCMATLSFGERPNILFIMSDDHAAQAISAYGGISSNICPTPNIDRLAKEGILFQTLTTTHKLIHFDKVDQWELYDLKRDPTEMQNLYGQPEYAAVTNELKVELERLRDYYGDRIDDVGDNPW